MVLLSTSVWGRCLQAGASPLDPFSRVATPGRRGTYDTAAPESFLLSRTPPSPQPCEIPVLQPVQTPGLLPRDSPPYWIVAALVVCAAPLAGSMDAHAQRIAVTIDLTGSVIDYTGSGPPATLGLAPPLRGGAAFPAVPASKDAGSTGRGSESLVKKTNLLWTRADREDRRAIPSQRSLDGDCAGISRRENFQEGGRRPSRRMQLRVAVRFVTAAPRTDSQNQPAALRCSLCSAACCVAGHRTPRFTVQFLSPHRPDWSETSDFSEPSV